MNLLNKNDSQNILKATSNIVPNIQYRFTPYLLSQATIVKMFVVILFFILYLIYVIYLSAGLKLQYVPNFRMFIDFFKDDNDTSMKRFYGNIHSLVNDDLLKQKKQQDADESFTNKKEESLPTTTTTPKTTPTKIITTYNINLKFENYLQQIKDNINYLLLKLFYINGNKITVKREGS
jgi:hypothetical protein